MYRESKEFGINPVSNFVGFTVEDMQRPKVRPLMADTPNCAVSQKAQYPLIKEYGLNYIGLHIMI